MSNTTEYHCTKCTYERKDHSIDTTNGRRGPWCYACNAPMVEFTAEEKIAKAVRMAKKHGFTLVAVPVQVLEELLNFEEANDAVL